MNTRTSLHPLNPSMHRAYVDAEDRLLRIEGVPELLVRRATSGEEEIDAIDVSSVRPDQRAGNVGDPRSAPPLTSR